MIDLDYDEISKLYENRKNNYQLALGQKEEINNNIQRIDDSIEKLINENENLILVDSLLKQTADFSREQASKQIESIVSSCLNLVFNNNLEFKIELSQLRGKNSAEFFVVEKKEDQVYQYKIQDSRGGGVIDIISLALRLAFLLKYKPEIEGPLILDEPAKHVSEDYIFNVANFIKKISEEFDKQIILISHNEHISSIGDKCYRIIKKDLISEIETINF
ncbi:ATPase [Miniphocaeibacter massiliensis]|uniref:ATPase n=1 Tax=Miniphocaeibacter massiliensis TaxID=2041841 RepID=UPI000C083D66|nr:ATPase [Miniphocaeibacter massiliensis]